MLESLELQAANRKKKKKKKLSHCEWVHDHVTDFINSGPTSRSDLHVNLPDTLTEEEKLQIVNLVPTEIVDLFLIIDNLNERFTEAQQEELLTIIQASTTKMNDDDCDQPQPEVCTSEENPFVADPVLSREDTMDGMTVEPTNEEEFTTSMDAEAVTPTPPNVPSVTLQPTDHNDIALNSVDTKHVMNGTPIPPSTENVRNGLVSLSKIKLELS